MQSYGGYVFTSVANNDGSRDLGCIVEATHQRCPGFPILNEMPAPPLAAWSGLAPILDGSGAPTGICAQTGVSNLSTA
jgi:hypothetical protein